MTVCSVLGGAVRVFLFWCKGVLKCKVFVGFFFFNDTATTEIYTLSLHDALPIYFPSAGSDSGDASADRPNPGSDPDRKSTRLNSSHGSISYAVFCLKKKKHKLPQAAIKKKPEQQHQNKNKLTTQ